jgi:ribosomal protein S30
MLSVTPQILAKQKKKQTQNTKRRGKLCVTTRLEKSAGQNLSVSERDWNTRGKKRKTEESAVRDKLCGTS